MKEELINLKTAKLAKEKGFQETCLFWFDELGNHRDGEIGKLSSYDSICNNNLDYDYSITPKEVWEDEECICRPTQAMLQKMVARSS